MGGGGIGGRGHWWSRSAGKEMEGCGGRGNQSGAVARKAGPSTLRSRKAGPQHAQVPKGGPRHAQVPKGACPQHAQVLKGGPRHAQVRDPKALTAPLQLLAAVYSVSAGHGMVGPDNSMVGPDHGMVGPDHQKTTSFASSAAASLSSSSQLLAPEGFISQSLSLLSESFLFSVSRLALTPSSPAP